MPGSRRETKLAIWDASCRGHRVLECSVSLFARSTELEALVVSGTRRVFPVNTEGVNRC